MRCFKEADPVMKEFERTYRRSPWKKYIEGVGIRRLDAGDATRANAQEGDIAIVVLTLQPLPKSCGLPGRFMRLPVVLEMVTR